MELKDIEQIQKIDKLCFKSDYGRIKLKDLQIKLAIIKDCIDYKEAIDCIVQFCVKYACNIKYESISIDCNTYNAEICKYLMLEHNFKIQKNMIMMIMGEDNIFKNKNTILLTRLAG